MKSFFIFIITLILTSCGQNKPINQELKNNTLESIKINGLSCDKCVTVNFIKNQVLFKFNNEVETCLGEVTFELQQDLQLPTINSKENHNLKNIIENTCSPLNGASVVFVENVDNNYVFTLGTLEIVLKK